MLMFMVMCWAPVIVTFILIKIKGLETSLCKETIAVGYGLFFAFVCLTGKTNLTCMYVYPVAGMLMLYKDKFLLVRVGIANFLLITVRLVMQMMGGGLTKQDITEYEIMYMLVVLIYVGYVLSVAHIIKSEQALLGSVQENLDRVVKTVEEVKVLAQL